MPETTPLIKAALNLRVGAGFDVYQRVAVLITYSPQNGLILLLMTFLISPMGLSLAAIWLLGKVQDFH